MSTPAPHDPQRTFLGTRVGPWPPEPVHFVPSQQLEHLGLPEPVRFDVASHRFRRVIVVDRECGSEYADFFASLEQNGAARPIRLDGAALSLDPLEVVSGADSNGEVR